MKIVFRVDASTQIGSGHVMRCLTLADALKNHNCCVTFISRNLPGNLNKFIKKRNFDLIVLPFEDKKSKFFEKKNSYKQFLSEEINIEIEQLVVWLDKLMPDWIIVDHYSLDILWETAIKKGSRKIMVIDDLANRKHSCDLLLDQNYYIDLADRYDALIPSLCHRLLGPQYALIKPSLLNIYAERERIGKYSFNVIKKIVLFMGGSDSDNMTLEVLRYMKQRSLLNCYEIHVIIGLINANREAITKFCFNNGILSYIFPNNFDDFLVQADLFIGAGGSSVYERCLAAIPSIVFSLAENQRKICEDVAKIGAHIFLDKIDDLAEIIKKLNSEQLSFMCQNSRKMFINYKGAEGVVDEIQSCWDYDR